MVLSNGTPIFAGVIMASYDCVALDIVASELIGIDPLKVPTNKAALSRGFGTEHPEIVGAPLEEVKVRFKRPEGGITALHTIFSYEDPSKAVNCKTHYQHFKLCTLQSMCFELFGTCH